MPMRIPRYEHKTYTRGGADHLRDACRDILVSATPEEHVRQDVLRYLMEELGYPAERLFTEVPIAGKKSNIRADIIATVPEGSQVKVSFADGPRGPETDVGEEPYDSRAQRVAKLLAPYPYFHVLPMPEKLDLDIEGHSVPVRLRGFEIGQCVMAVFQPLESALGYPPLFKIMAGGYGRTKWETDIALCLGLACCTCHDDELVEDFSDEIYEVFGPEPGAWPVYEFTIHARDTDCGLLAIYPTHRDTYGVLTFYERPIPKKEAEIERRKTEPAKPQSGEGPQKTNPSEHIRTRRFRGEERPLLVVECKSDRIPISEQSFDQGKRYADKLQALFLVCSNGAETEIRARKTPQDAWREVTLIPSYRDLLSSTGARLDLDKRGPNRSGFSISKASSAPYVILWGRSRNCLGLDTPWRLWPAILEIDRFLGEGEPFFSEPFAVYGLTFLEDWGYKYHWFGNYSGGVFQGFYRGFLVRGKDGMDQVLRLNVQANHKSINHPSWGHRTSTSILSVTRSVPEQRHNSLELNLDGALLANTEDNVWEIRHKGSLTVGKSGAVKRARVVEFVQRECPELVREGKVYLGSFPKDTPLTWENAGDCICRLAAYAVIRDRLREEIKRAKKDKAGQ